MEFAIEKPAALLLGIAAAAVEECASRPESPIVAVVFSAIWLEAYFNQLIEVIDFRVRAGSETAPQEVMDAIGEQRELEKTRKQLPDKIARFAETLTGKEQDRGASPYQDLELLISLRSVLVHCWPTRVRAAEGENSLSLTRNSSSTPNVAKLVKQLADRGALTKEYASTNPPIVEAIRKPGVARWALDAAQTVARFIADCFPTEGMRLWANRENALSGAPPARYFENTTVRIRLPD